MTSSYSEVLPEALTTAKIIEHPSIRAEALSKLALLASQNQEILSEAFSAAIGLKYAEDRIKALIRLASFLSENQLSGVLEATRIIEKETHLSLAFPQLAFFLQKPLLVRALEIAKLIKNDECRIEKEIHLSLALSELAPFLPRHLLLRALEIAELIKNDECRTEALIGLVSYLHEILPQILVTTKAIKNDKFRAKAFGKLAKYLPELLPEALESTKIITSRYGDTCAEVLLNIAPYLKESRFVEALEITKAIGDVQYRAKALSS